MRLTCTSICPGEPQWANTVPGRCLHAPISCLDWLAGEVSLRDDIGWPPGRYGGAGDVKGAEELFCKGARHECRVSSCCVSDKCSVPGAALE